MPRQELYINGQDAFDVWGISFDSNALSTLMTPAPLKGMIENKSALEDGKRVIRTGRKLDERTVTLGFNITAVTKAAFLQQYANFCTNVLSLGKVNIRTKYQQNVVYHMDYLSCQSFGEYRQTMGKFVLRLVEPNPADRTQGTNE